LCRKIGLILIERRFLRGVEMDKRGVELSVAVSVSGKQIPFSNYISELSDCRSNNLEGLEMRPQHSLAAE
jgi:hypothetical protein